MKRTFTTILLLIFTGFLFADPVSKEYAKIIAEKFYAYYAQKDISAIQIDNVIIEEYNGETAFYTFTFGSGGFVMISADDKANPVIGYSTKSPYKNQIDNPTIRYFYDRLKKDIDHAKNLENTKSEVKQLWEDYTNGKFGTDVKKVGTPLLTTTWDQSPYYNNYCPSSTPTGCVATAMSQIMNYHEWPATGNSWHRYIPSSNPVYGEQYADFASTTYDWANMPTSLSAGSTNAQVTAIAKLMYHAGVSVNMDYKSTGSGAFSSDVLYALSSFFKYDPTTLQMINFNVAQQTSWITSIKAEIDNNRPVYYSGSSTASGGHAWVCDGYNGDLVHINWGWGGSNDGYYQVTAMNPSPYNFSEQNSIIIGIKPGVANQDVQWVKQASAFTAKSRYIQNISAVNDRIAWGIASDGSGSQAKVREFTVTSDGGANWKSGTISATGITTNMEGGMISAVDEKNAWAALFDGVNGGGKIAKTSDGGSTWAVQSSASFTAPNGFPNVVHFWDANNGFCMGDPNGGYFEIYTTTNGGTTWTRVASNKIPANQSSEYGTVGCYDVYGDIVWFATNKGRIFKSTDKGYNWSVYSTPITDSYFELTFKDANTGVIQRRGDGAKTAYLTTNGGANWTQITTTGNFYTSSLTYVPGTDTLVSVGSDYQTPFMGVSYSTDNGATFTDYADFYKNFQFISLGASSKNSIWAGCFNDDQYGDGMWHYGKLGLTAGFTINKTTAAIGDNTIILTDKSYGTPDTWSWNFGDGATIATATGKGPHTIGYTTSGNKTITLTVTKGAGNDIVTKQNIIFISTSVGIDDIESKPQFGIYPNPAKENIYVSNIDNANVSIYNTSGVLLLELNNVKANSPIRIADLKNGLYYVKVSNQDISSTQILSIVK